VPITLRPERIFITAIEDHITLEKGEGGLPNRLHDTKTNHNKNPMMQIPKELMEFVRHDTYSLLVKGDAGTGKTTLSLTILRALRIRANFFYISTRLSPKQLFIYYPWLGKYMDIVNQDEIPPQTSSQQTSYNAPSFEDARLDEPESLFERITNQLMDVKAPIIIIDSWDAVASFMDKEARLNNERVLQTWRERAGAKLIFISENPNDTTLDFLVDGIVNLSQRFYAGARVREMTLTKLRGIRINKSCYIFSLNNGTFKSYAPSDPSDFVINQRATDIQFNSTIPKIIKKDYAFKSDKTKRHYISSSYKQLDTALGGGFPEKSLVFIESHSEVSIKVISLLVAGLISNNIDDGNPTVIENSREIDAELIKSYLLTHPRKSSEGKSDLLRIFPPGFFKEGLRENLVSPNQKLGKYRQMLESVRDVMAKTRRKYPDNPLVNVTGLDTFREICQLRDPCSAVSMRNVFAHADLTFVVGCQDTYDDFEILDFDIHLYVQYVRGTLVLHAVVPETHPYVIIIDRSHRYPVIKLEPLI
jgi:KaiC/GvpD/RAD55 family RecA-like ATPase